MIVFAASLFLLQAGRPSLEESLGAFGGSALLQVGLLRFVRLCRASSDMIVFAASLFLLQAGRPSLEESLGALGGSAVAADWTFALCQIVSGIE